MFTSIATTYHGRHHTRLDAKAHHRDCVQELGVESEDWRAVGQRCSEQGFGLLRLTNRRAIDDAFRGLPGYTGARFQPAPRFVSFTWLVPVRERGLGVVCAFHSLCSVVLCCALVCSGVLCLANNVSHGLGQLLSVVAMRIVSWNVNGLGPTASFAKYHHGSVRAWLDSLDADIVCVQVCWCSAPRR